MNPATPMPLAQSNQQDQVLRAINDSVSSTVPTELVFGILGGVLVLLFAVAFYQRTRKASAPGSRQFVRDRKKLMREVVKELALSPTEVNKLKHHAERLGVEHPLTLLLCPSLSKKQEQGKSEG